MFCYSYKNEPNLVCTERIATNLSAAYYNFATKKKLNVPFEPETINLFLSNANTIKFVMSRQPNMTPIPEDVLHNIQKHFQNKDVLQRMELLEVFRASNHPEDDHLYGVIAKVRGSSEFACWTSWNSDEQSLNNYGHYMLESREDALDILKEHFNDITDEPERFGIEQSRTEFPRLLKQPERDRSNQNVVEFRRKGR